MILSAILIQNEFLFDEIQIINFGGKYFYSFKSQGDKLLLSRELNASLIKKYYDDVSMISAIVGANGVGKTNLLRILNQHKEQQNSIFIYEDEDEILIHNHTKTALQTLEFDFQEIFDNDRLSPLYYSPVIDHDLGDIYSPISLTRKFTGSLSEYFFDNLERQLFFLSSSNIEKFKEIYPDLPFFDTLKVKVNNFDKKIFLKIYKEAKLGDTLNQELEAVWNKYKSNNDLIHDGEDFLKNLKVMLLSLLVMDDTYGVTNNNGFDVGFDEVINQNTFTKKLSKFLEKRISNIDGPTYTILKKNYSFELNDADQLIDRIKRNKLSKIPGGFNFEQIKSRMIQCIEAFKAVYEFYSFIRGFNLEGRLKSDKNEVFIEFKVNERSEVESVISEYKKLITTFKNTIQFSNFRILNFYPDRKLSTGEKSLLDFFSILYYFTIERRGHQRKKENYLLLLDEPELGYHALWKKKFIDAIIKIVPLIFKDLEKEPSVQVIFTTHDALTLSDLLSYNVVYLQKIDRNAISNVIQIGFDSFGANITDILANSFFVGDGLIGDYAKNKIQDVINYIEDAENRKSIDWIIEPGDAKKLIELIGEPFLRDKLYDMLLDEFPEFRESEIEKLELQLKELKKR